MSDTQLTVANTPRNTSYVTAHGFCIMTNVTISPFFLITENHVAIQQFPPIECNNTKHITNLTVTEPVQTRSSTCLALLNRTGHHGKSTKTSKHSSRTKGNKHYLSPKSLN